MVLAHRILTISVNFGRMTIRQYLKRRSDRYATMAFAFLLVVGIVTGIAPRILAIRIIFAVLVAVLPVAAFWSLFETPCPNCGKRLGGVGFWVSVGRTSKVPEHCPHCGIGVDVHMPIRGKAGAER
jgi:uncharacterized membrane protein YphA (DoxX/SURF4 family)